MDKKNDDSGENEEPAVDVEHEEDKKGSKKAHTTESKKNVDADEGLITPENAEAAKKAEAEREQYKKDNPLKERMENMAKKAAGGTSTGMGLASVGAQIAKAVKETKKDGDKISVSTVVKDL